VDGPSGVNRSGTVERTPHRIMAFLLL
jgi:hypothetical protein